MIEKIRLHNFKCFDENEFSLSGLTVFAGKNASGKSSLIQSLLLLRQSYESGYINEKKLQLNGRLYSIGTVRDIILSGAEDRKIIIEITENSKMLRYVFEYAAGELDTYNLELRNDFPADRVHFASQPFSYLCAERLGPRKLYEIPERMQTGTDVGIHGEYAISVLEHLGNEPAANSKLAEQFPTLRNAVKYWMNQIIPNFDLNYTRIIEADSVSLQFKDANFPLHSIRPVNTGFGISYTLPVVISALTLPEHAILIAENPEAHLHPSAQSMMGQFLAKAALSGIQVIIETHSDHIINGIRLAVKMQPELSEKNVIHFFYFLEGMRKNFEIRIDCDGNLDNSPEGFFDQIENDLMRLF